ncbi:nonsense-mediated decay protein [Aureococcus anophagefferens]|uniref:Nonsense-mediated decay protein n=1 Tax=Aureococcus anophagefferens TaxID=44056 RepID=A0ABR1FR81_AURAN
MRLAILLSALLQQSQPLQTRPSLRRATRLHAREDAYASYWDELLLKEYREAAAELRSRRQTWSRKRLEDSGDSVFGAATPETELFGDKIAACGRGGAPRAAAARPVPPRRRAAAEPRGPRAARPPVPPARRRRRRRGRRLAAVGAGARWRRRLGVAAAGVLRRAPRPRRAARALEAQRDALARVAAGAAGEAAALLAQAFAGSAARRAPGPLRDGARLEFAGVPGGVTAPSLEIAALNAIGGAKDDAGGFEPNASQEDAIAWALARSVSLIRGPPGTGKTRCASLLVSSALRLGDGGAAPRVLAVCHSNGAADVLLAALVAVGVPAIRAGRPASVAPEARRHTVVALAERHPEVSALRERARNATLKPHVRSAAAADARKVVDEVREALSRNAPVVVASCVGRRVGAHQLIEASSGEFSLVVVDEAAQTTEPAVLCALAAAKADQIVFVGDTKQLPPTVVSEDAALRRALATSPMSAASVQYRMPPALVEHPSNYFYEGLVACADDRREGEAPPAGFPWPGGLPLAFVDVRAEETKRASGGVTNAREAELVAAVVAGVLEAGELGPRDLVVISPYNRQCDAVRGALARRGVYDVRVGTVDAFQGQETQLVVFTAARSNPRGDLGFLRDPRRLNVAITRAKRGLVLVGDAATLSNSRHWRALVDSCRDRGAWVDGDAAFPELELC